MKVQIVVEMGLQTIKRLQEFGRLTAEVSPRQALKEELQAVLVAHIETLEGEADEL